MNKGTKEKIVSAAKQAIFGDLQDDVSKEGVAAQIGLSLTGLDAHLDIEALIKDAKDFKLTPGHIWNTAFDGVCLLSVIGALKDVGKAEDAMKAEKMLGEIDVLSDASKEVNAVEGVGKGVKINDIIKM